MQDEDVALFSIAGNHLGYEDQLDLPNRINFAGATAGIGPFKFDLASFTKPFTMLVNFVNGTAVKVFEWVQFDAYGLSFLVVSGLVWCNTSYILPDSACC